MTTAAVSVVSVFEDLAYQRVKREVAKSFDDTLRGIVDVDGASEGEKKDACEKVLGMFRKATEEFIVSKHHQR